MRPRLLAFLVFAVLTVPAVAEPPCEADLRAGKDAAWLAQLKEAREAFRRAAEIEACRARALVGLAEVERRRGKEEAAIEAARAALDAAGDNEETLAEAYFQIGRAVEEQGWRRSEDRQILAEDALRRAVQVSGGDHREAVRALQRLYAETGRDEALAKVQEANPDVVATTESSRKALVTPRRRGPSAAGRGGAGGWQRDMPQWPDERATASARAQDEATGG